MLRVLGLWLGGLFGCYLARWFGKCLECTYIYIAIGSMVIVTSPQEKEILIESSE